LFYGQDSAKISAIDYVLSTSRLLNRNLPFPPIRLAWPVKKSGRIGRQRPIVISQATNDHYDALLATLSPFDNVASSMAAFEKKEHVEMSYDKLCRLNRAKAAGAEELHPGSGRRQLLSPEACRFITSLIRGHHTTKGSVPFALLAKLMRALLAAELGWLSDNALRPLQVILPRSNI